MTETEAERERRKRLDRLVKMLDRIRMRTERETELGRALRESERVGARRERERCAEWLESLECGDDGVALLMLDVARALRREAMPDDL